MLNEYPDIKNMVLKSFTSNFISEILKEMKINVRAKFLDFKLISSLKINKELKLNFLSTWIISFFYKSYVGYSENENPNGLGVLYDQNIFISMCGLFKSGFIEGIGRINYDNGNVYEGLMRKKEHQIGFHILI